MAKDPVRVLVTGAAGKNTLNVYFRAACPICHFVFLLLCGLFDVYTVGSAFSVGLLVGSLVYCLNLMV